MSISYNHYSSCFEEKKFMASFTGRMSFNGGRTVLIEKRKEKERRKWEEKHESSLSNQTQSIMCDMRHSIS